MLRRDEVICPRPHNDEVRFRSGCAYVQTQTLLTVFKIVVHGRVTLKYLFKGLIFDKLYY